MSKSLSSAPETVPAPFEERSVWIQFISLLVAMGGYFVLAGLLLKQGVDRLPPFVPVFALAVVVLVVINAVFHASAAIHRRPEGRDERDRIIAWRAEHGSSWLVGVGVLAAITMLCIGVAPVWVAHLLLLSLFLSELLGCLLRLRYYRAGLVL